MGVHADFVGGAEIRYALTAKTLIANKEVCLVKKYHLGHESAVIHVGEIPISPSKNISFPQSHLRSLPSLYCLSVISSFQSLFPLQLFAGPSPSNNCITSPP